MFVFQLMATSTNLLLVMLILSTPIVAVGVIVYAIGIVRMSRPDTN